MVETLDAAVLRQAALGDVEPGHDLDAGRDRGGKARGRGVRLVQHAIIAVTHAQTVLEWLDMNVGCLGLHRAGDDLVDQPDHRRLARQILQPLGIFLQPLRLAIARLAALFGLGIVAIQPVESGLELDRQGHFEPHRLAGGSGDRLRGEAIERIGHCQNQRIAVQRHRHSARGAQKTRGEPVGKQTLFRVAVAGDHPCCEQIR
jgi:hypothetical protein